MTPDDLAARRAAVDAKQATVVGLLADMGCEAAVLLLPAHVAWFTGGLTARGLLADTERPGLYVSPAGRWLVCSNADTQRVFDDDLDGQGFQLKEWAWAAGRAGLLGELLSDRKVAVDRPYPGLPLLTERLRAELRPLAGADRDRYLAFGREVAEALEAVARTVRPGDTEAEVAGQVAHRLVRHAAEVSGVSVAADGRGQKYRRSGTTGAAVTRGCVVQATAGRGGLFVSAARAVCFGPPGEPAAREWDLAVKLAAVLRSRAKPGETIPGATAAGHAITADTPYEYDWRLAPAGYGTGWFPAEELRRGPADDPFADGQAVVWQARVGAAAVVDTVLVGADGPTPVTPPGTWPYKRIQLRGHTYDIPDVLVREG